jgi:hypothetical protein
LTDLEPEAVLDRWLSNKGNTVVPQVPIQWKSLPAEMATWEDYNVVKTRFPEAIAWEQTVFSAGALSCLLMAGRWAFKVEAWPKKERKAPVHWRREMV